MTRPEYDLRLGDYRDVLDGETWDALVCDPPYSERTHNGHNSVADAHGGARRAELAYTHWTPDDVRAMVEWAHPRTRSWMVCFTSSDLCDAYRKAFRSVGRIDFAPIPAIQPGRSKRAWGDGPPSWADYIMVARPREKRFINRWYPPGHYIVSPPGKSAIVSGAKPLDLMDAVVCDYSRPGDVICDITAGGGTTLLAAVRNGRYVIGAERDPETHARALARLHAARSLPLFDASATLDLFATPSTTEPR